MQEVVTSVAGDAKPSVENKSMTDADFLSARIAKLTANAPKAEAEKPAPVPDEEPKPEANPQEGEPKVEETQKEVLSKDISELTDDEIAELAVKGKSGLLRRIAELTAKRKLAEERAAALEAAINQAKQQLPERVENNPYSNVADISQLQAKKQEVDEVIEWAEDVLFKSEDMAATDIVATVEGREYTKADIRDSLRKARKARDKYLPAQFQELQAKEQRGQLEVAFKQQARKELNWLEGEDNDTRKRFEAMVNDPRLRKIKESVPEIAPQIEYLIAHAANSMWGRRSIAEPDKPKSPTLSPPSNPSPAAAAPERAESRIEKSIKDVEGRFKQTGNPNDWVALRTAQLSKRK